MLEMPIRDNDWQNVMCITYFNSLKFLLVNGHVLILVLGLGHDVPVLILIPDYIWACSGTSGTRNSMARNPCSGKACWSPDVSSIPLSTARWTDSFGFICRVINHMLWIMRILIYYESDTSEDKRSFMFIHPSFCTCIYSVLPRHQHFNSFADFTYFYVLRENLKSQEKIMRRMTSLRNLSRSNLSVNHPINVSKWHFAVGKHFWGCTGQENL